MCKACETKKNLTTTVLIGKEVTDEEFNHANITFDTETKTFMLNVDAGCSEGSITVTFCPFCGKRLK